MQRGSITEFMPQTVVGIKPHQLKPSTGTMYMHRIVHVTLHTIIEIN